MSQSPEGAESVSEGVYVRLVPEAERISGPGTSAIMAAFTHLNPNGSRFSDGSYGVFYCARALETAIAETSHHRARFLAATREARMELDMRVYLVDLEAELHDLRGMPVSGAAIYARDDYAAGQSLGRALRAAGDGKNGIAVGRGGDEQEHANGPAHLNPAASRALARAPISVRQKPSGQSIRAIASWPSDAVVTACPAPTRTLERPRATPGSSSTRRTRAGVAGIGGTVPESLVIADTLPQGRGAAACPGGRSISCQEAREASFQNMVTARQ